MQQDMDIQKQQSKRKKSKFIFIDHLLRTNNLYLNGMEDINKQVKMMNMGP